MKAMLNTEIVNLANDRIKLEIAELINRLKSDITLCMSELASLGLCDSSVTQNKISELCSVAIMNSAQLIWQTLFRFVSTSGMKYSEELTTELKDIVKSHLPENLDNFRECLQPYRMEFLFERNLHNTRTHALRKIETEIELFTQSLKNQEKVLETQVQIPQKELEQKFGILLSAAQEQKDYEEWRSTCPTIGVLFLDIDGFKKLNEKHTETKIDATVLPNFQNLLKSLTDYRGGAYRHGGEEFVIILPNHTFDESCTFAEKIRAAIETHRFRIDQEETAVTVSVGIAVWPDHGRNFVEVLAAANSAEHVAKKQGGNRIGLP
jgi:diguanylate cyclase (GGDEF)-like protein